MTKVYNDLLLAADQADVSALCLLDLTAAFNTVDHDLLMLRLERQFGLRGVVLQWFSSYLSDRTFQVVIRSGTSSVVIITCSVPQGSVLGPRLFILYTADFADVVKAHNVNLQFYADDSQLYLRCQRQHMTTAGRRLEMCSTDVRHWMVANKLKSNADKTLTRRSSSGLVLSTVQLCLVAVDRHYGSEMRLSRPVIMCVYLASPSRRISAL